MGPSLMRFKRPDDSPLSAVHGFGGAVKYLSGETFEIHRMVSGFSKEW